MAKSNGRRSDTTADLGLEAKLWTLADALRADDADPATFHESRRFATYAKPTASTPSGELRVTEPQR